MRKKQFNIHNLFFRKNCQNKYKIQLSKDKEILRKPIRRGSEKDEEEKAARFPGENRIRRNTLIQYFSFHKGILDAIE